MVYFCYDNVVHLLSTYCKVGGCFNCKYHKDTGGCLKQELKEVLHVDCDYNLEIKKLKDAYELIDMIWENVKDSCDLGNFECEKCPFYNPSKCGRMKLREILIKEGFK